MGGLGYFGAKRGRFGVTLRSSGATVGYFWGPLGPPLGILGSSGATIGGTWIFWRGTPRSITPTFPPPPQPPKNPLLSLPVPSLPIDVAVGGRQHPIPGHQSPPADEFVPLEEGGLPGEVTRRPLDHPQDVPGRCGGTNGGGFGVTPGSSAATVGYFGVLRGHHWVFLGSSAATVGYFGVLRCHHWGVLDILGPNVGDLGSPRGPPGPPLGILGSSGATIGYFGVLRGHR